MRQRTVEQIIAAFKEANEKRMRRDYRAWKTQNPEKYSAAVALYNDGYSVKQIADHFGVTYETIRKQFIKDGIKEKQNYYKNGRSA